MFLAAFVLLYPTWMLLLGRTTSERVPAVRSRCHLSGCFALLYPTWMLLQGSTHYVKNAYLR